MIVNKSIPNDDKNDELIVILIKLKVNFRKRVNEPDFIEFNDILKVFRFYDQNDNQKILDFFDL